MLCAPRCAHDRTRVGEKGINDPPVKLFITIVAFCVLCGMSLYGVLDPSLAPTANASHVATDSRPLDTSRPLPAVCVTISYWGQGLLIFTIICSGCLGFVIFVTSKQSLSGLRFIVRPNGPPPPLRPTARDKLLGKCALFGIFFGVCALILAFFAFVPFYTNGTGATRNTADWQAACDAVDRAELRRMGL